MPAFRIERADRSRSPRRWLRALLLLVLLGSAAAAPAQDIEPRAYSNAPVGVNFAIVGAVWTRGGLPSDPAIPVTDASLRTSNLVLAYARTLDLWGRSGKFDAIVPYTRLDGSADYLGQPLERRITGFGAPALRLSINLHGAPALALRDFRGWKQDLIVGASVQVVPPGGQYDDTRIVNISSHRWAVKPEVGLSKASGTWTLEVQAAATFFGDNTRFYGDNTRAQRPLYALQGHAIHAFASGTWVSFDVTWFTGGRSTVNGALNNDLQRNWRAGVVFAIPVGRLDSLKLSASSGVAARTGNDFDALGIAWQHRWGGGL